MAPILQNSEVPNDYNTSWEHLDKQVGGKNTRW